MPISRRRNRIRMRRLRAEQALLGDKAGLRRRLGDLQRALDAKSARVEWQSGGIRMLQDRIVTLEALLATQPAMVDSVSQQRIMALEADLARLEVMMDSVLREGAFR